MIWDDHYERGLDLERFILLAMLLLEFKILVVQSIDTINHGLDKFNFGVSQTMLVGDVISTASLASRFSAGSTGLKRQFFAPEIKRKFVNHNDFNNFDFTRKKFNFSILHTFSLKHQDLPWSIREDQYGQRHACQYPSWWGKNAGIRTSHPARSLCRIRP